MLLAWPVALRATDPPRPNILFIVADDMGYADCGAHGCRDIPTPHLDTLAANGVRFTDGYVTGAVCSPSRAALLTGRHQLRDGVTTAIRPGGRGMDTRVPTLPEYLRKAGYRTALFGKWHLGESEECRPLNRGFDEFFGLHGGGRSYWPNTPVSAQYGGEDYIRLMRGREPAEETDYLTFALSREAVDFIARQKDRQEPFFLMLSFTAVHDPMEAPEDYLQRFAAIEDPGRRTYAAMMSAMDNAIGRVLKAVQDAGIERNTLICFLSDNGGPLTGYSANSSRNAPLRGGKGKTWEGGIRVPFFMAWSGHLPPGTKFSDPVTQLDLTATALALAGIKPDAHWPMDGTNLMPFLTGDRQGERPHEILCWEYGQQWAIREGPWKLTYALPSQDAKTPVLGLYDLSRDIAETRDLSALQPRRVEEMKRAWAAWRRDLAGGEAK